MQDVFFSNKYERQKSIDVSLLYLHWPDSWLRIKSMRTSIRWNSASRPNKND